MGLEGRGHGLPYGGAREEGKLGAKGGSRGASTLNSTDNIGNTEAVSVQAALCCLSRPDHHNHLHSLLHPASPPNPHPPPAPGTCGARGC